MKRKLLLGMLGTMVMMLSACGTENETEADDYANTDEWTLVEEENDTRAGGGAVSDVGENADAVSSSDTEGNVKTYANGSTDEYRKIYEQIVEKEEGDSLSFSLIYLNEDDIPELVVSDQYYLTYSIYTVKDGKSFCLIDSMATVELDYYEHSGIVSSFARWNGGGDEGGYGESYYQISGDKTLTDDDVSTLSYSYNAVNDEEGNWTGEGVTRYYHLGQEIDEAAYRQIADELGIVEGSEKYCGDNAYEKPAMLEHLKGLSAMSGTEDADAVKEAYYSVLDKLYTTYTLPDGTDLSYDGILDISDNCFAIYDIDYDGQEELIIVWDTTYTARQSVIVYGYDSAAGTVRTELWQYPLQIFYDNGVVEVGLSHNQGLASVMPDQVDFWPYFLYQYDKSTDTYVQCALVDAWNKAYRETDYDGNAFPDDIDVDGDGVVYLIEVGESEEWMDAEAYQSWRDSYIGGANEVAVPFKKMTEEWRDSH